MPSRYAVINDEGIVTNIIVCEDDAEYALGGTLVEVDDAVQIGASHNAGAFVNPLPPPVAPAPSLPPSPEKVLADLLVRKGLVSQTDIAEVML